MNNSVNNKEKRENRRFTIGMQKKLVVLFGIVLLAFVGLSIRLIMINKESGDQYKKRVLSQLEYDSTTIPYKRGAIVDANGTTLAVSQKKYNVIIDSKIILSNPKYLQPTVDALEECFALNSGKMMAYIETHPNSSYYKVLNRLSYDEIADFIKLTEDKKNNPYIKGIWFEEEYVRSYPYGSLACDVIGFTTSDGTGMYGLEQYYNERLIGMNGRSYGYLSEDSQLERTTIAAKDGETIKTTIDVNIQSVVEKYLKAFNDEHKNEYRISEAFKDEYRPAEGSYHSACIVMNPNNGEILAMAEYPNFDLNSPYDLSAYFAKEQLESMENDAYYRHLNELWSNFCIASTYEPGSTAKAFTVAMGLETGAIRGNEKYECKGGLQVADYYINCNNRYGHKTVTVSQALERSCNVALMYMGQKIGKDSYLKFQDLFNVGNKTGIDLVGETKTSALVYNEKTMGITELSTSSFGQGYNVTMIQMAAAFSSLINGGYYYEPHMVKEILSADGAVVDEIAPRVLKQTISNDISDKMITYLNNVASDGTGKTARPAGYKIGGKTGTAEIAGRDGENYVVSFIGYAPADDPQVVVYVVIDRPNVEDQAHAYYAAGVVRNIFTEILPYMNIFKTEEMTDAEIDELVKLGLYRTESGEYVDLETGYILDEETGKYKDPVTGEIVEDISKPLVEDKKAE